MSNDHKVPTSSSPSSWISPNYYEIPDLKSIWVLVTINKYLLSVLENERTRNALKFRCTSKLRIQKQEFFEFSEQSVLSNLYWSIDSIEAAILTQQPEERSFRLSNSEQMLQVPAMLDEEGFTATIPNRYLVCCSYFYLSVVRKLQGDEWQTALHLLQAVLVSPELVWSEFAPELCESLFPSSKLSQKQDGSRILESISAQNSEDEINAAVREMARRYKECLMYYQVMLYGETPRRHSCRREKSVHPVNEPNIGHRSSTSVHKPRLQTSKMYEKVHPFDPQDVIDTMVIESKGFTDIDKYEDYKEALKQLNSVQVHNKVHQKISSVKCLKDMLEEVQSKAPSSVDSCYADFIDKRDMAHMDDRITTAIRNANYLQPETSDRSSLLTESYSSRDQRSNTHLYCRVGDEVIEEAKQPLKLHLADHIAFTSARKHGLSSLRNEEGNSKSERKLQTSSGLLAPSAGYERRISILHHSEVLKNCLREYTTNIATTSESLTSSSGTTYTFLKDVILDQLLIAISTSKEEREIRASVSMLTNIISMNKSLIEDIKKKGLKLQDLASALKQNVHEAAILIYLINPSPIDIKTLGLLPTLLEIVCTSHSYKGKPESLLLTPHAASLMIIEELVTSFDYATNNMHLAVISSPHVLHRLLDIARNNNLEEFFSLVTILIKCIKFDAHCRKYVSQFTPLGPFLHLLQINNKRAKCMALEFFHEILCIPRSSAINLLQRIQKEGSDNIMETLMLSVHQLQPDYQLLAANILLQLDTLTRRLQILRQHLHDKIYAMKLNTDFKVLKIHNIMQNSHGESVFRQEAVQVLLKALASQETSKQILSASILSNIAGTYAWTGESYTAAWLLRKTGLASPRHQNMIRNFDWLDQSLQDTGTDLWCGKIAKCIMSCSVGDSIFHALERGLRSKMKRVSRDCLVAIAWLGCQISKNPDSLRYSSCENLLSGIQQFLHPGMELEERLLACLCIYNYASGKGKQQLIHFSEGVKESLRRLSNVTWMAEELHRVADYMLPNISRISCVHTQILEAGHNLSKAVHSLMYYKGLLFSGYSDGSIKVWDIRGHSATLVWDIKGHKKSVTCFSLYEPSDSLLSGSSDKTIRVWTMIQSKLECTEVIDLKEPIHRIYAQGHTIFVITQKQEIKLLNESRVVRDIFKGKYVNCMALAQGKLYVGCKDSSIQEYSATCNRELEIKAPTRSWRKQNRPINSVVAYRDWLYSASKLIEGSTFKDWKKNGKPLLSVTTGRRDDVLAMEVVEDFLYLISSSSANNIQIWLRGEQRKVGRLSAGSKITSLLSANDIILCGTEMGLIKGWIPL